MYILLPIFLFPWVHVRVDTARPLTSIKASGQQVPLANGPVELWGRPVNESAGLSGLGLGSPAVPELGANHQEALGRRLRRDQPAGRLSLCIFHKYSDSAPY